VESLQSLADQLSHAVNALVGPAADFLAGYVWGWPAAFPLIAAVLLATGMFVTVRLAVVQIRGFRHAIDITRGKYDDPDDEGDLNHFQALTTALSATVGIGNIAGVAIAIRMGGPGALFWMWVTAFFGMALKYAECTLAVRYRDVHPDGSVSGGPMYYIEKGLGRSWKPLALFFAGCAVIASFGGGCMNQSNTLATQIKDEFGIHPIFSAIVFTALVALVIIGGIRRIGRVTSILAPGMALLYVLGAMYILMVNAAHIPSGFRLIFANAFSPEGVVGGGVASFMLTLLWGVKRGLFSNEAGQGSAPIAHATAKTDRPVREGLVASLEPFIDTLVICTMTGLVIVMTGAWDEKSERTVPIGQVEAVLAESPAREDLPRLWDERAAAGSTTLDVVDGRLIGGAFTVLHATVDRAVVVDADGRPWNGRVEVDAAGALRPQPREATLSVRGDMLLTGSPLTAQGFRHGLPGKWGGSVVTIAVVLFAVSTGISWSYYGDRATEYLFGSRFIPLYRWVFIAFFFLGCLLSLDAVWTYGDVALGLMTAPNLIALLFLSRQVSTMTRDYFRNPEERH